MALELFKRHTASTVFLAFYFAWWTLLIYLFVSGSLDYPDSCGAANGALLMLTFLVAAIYALILIIKIGLTQGQKRSDYLKFLGLVLLPVISVILFIVLIVLIDSFSRGTLPR